MFAAFAYLENSLLKTQICSSNSPPGSHFPRSNVHTLLLHTRFLLGWLFADRHADDSPGRQNAFMLLRAVLSRKIVVPEVYDVMEWVQEVMVK